MNAVHYAATLHDGLSLIPPSTAVPCHIRTLPGGEGLDGSLAADARGVRPRNIYLPYDLAYGARGATRRASTVQPLVFRHGLLKVKEEKE